jgi:hypothetical protein
MKNIAAEIVKDFDGTYYINMTINGETVRDLPEYVSYKTLRAAVRKKCAFDLPPLSAVRFVKYGRKKYAYLHGTN